MYRLVTFINGIVRPNQSLIPIEDLKYTRYEDAYAAWRKTRIKPDECDRARLFRCNEYGHIVKCIKDKPRLKQKLPRAIQPGDIKLGRDLPIPDASLPASPNPHLPHLIQHCHHHPNDRKAAKALRKAT